MPLLSIDILDTTDNAMEPIIEVFLRALLFFVVSIFTQPSVST